MDCTVFKYCKQCRSSSATHLTLSCCKFVNEVSHLLQDAPRRSKGGHLLETCAVEDLIAVLHRVTQKNRAITSSLTVLCHIVSHLRAILLLISESAEFSILRLWIL